MVQHTVEQGETMPRIATAWGFCDYRTIWDHPKNAGLKGLRDPCVLMPGDAVFIPERQPKATSVAVDMAHVFAIQRPRLTLVLILQNSSGAPQAGLSGMLTCGAASFAVTTDDAGRIEQRIAVDATFAALTLEGGDTTLMIGALDPLDEPSGWRARLSNLGYPVGENGATNHEAALRLAVEEFQCDSDLPVTGVRDAATRDKLLAAHGA